MDSHQRRLFRREIRRLGLEPGILGKSALSISDRAKVASGERLVSGKLGGKEPKLKWQDAIGLVGLLLGVGSAVDMPTAWRVLFYAVCTACLLFSFLSHKNWSIKVRSMLALLTVLLMGFMAWRAVSRPIEHTPTAEENAEATASLLSKRTSNESNSAALPNQPKSTSSSVPTRDSQSEKRLPLDGHSLQNRSDLSPKVTNPTPIDFTYEVVDGGLLLTVRNDSNFDDYKDLDLTVNPNDDVPMPPYMTFISALAQTNAYPPCNVIDHSNRFISPKEAVIAEAQEGGKWVMYPDRLRFRCATFPMHTYVQFLAKVSKWVPSTQSVPFTEFKNVGVVGRFTVGAHVVKINTKFKPLN